MGSGRVNRLHLLDISRGLWLLGALNPHFRYQEYASKPRYIAIARAKRHFLPRYAWHITHRCHKREFLIKLQRVLRSWMSWLSSKMTWFLTPAAPSRAWDHHSPVTPAARPAPRRVTNHPVTIHYSLSTIHYFLPLLLPFLFPLLLPLLVAVLQPKIEPAIVLPEVRFAFEFIPKNEGLGCKGSIWL